MQGPNVRSGGRSFKIGLQKPVKTKNAFGEQIVSWTTDSQPWVKITPMQDLTRGGEYFFAKQIHSNISHKVEMRYQTLSASTAITPDCRIRWGSKILKILSVVNEGEMNRKLILRCAEDQ